jgi:hypothetical protein
MWKKDVEGFTNDGRRLTVSLGGKDLIVNTEAVGRYLANSSTNKGGECGVGTRRENKDCISLCLMENAWKQRKWEGMGWMCYGSLTSIIGRLSTGIG